MDNYDYDTLKRAAEQPGELYPTYAGMVSAIVHYGEITPAARIKRLMTLDAALKCIMRGQ